MNSLFILRKPAEIKWHALAAVTVASIFFGLLISRVTPTKSLVYLVALALVWSFLKKPRFALYAVVLCSPFYFIFNDLSTSGMLAGLRTSLSPIDILTAAAVLGSFFHYLNNRAKTASRSSVLILGLGWLLISIVSLLYGRQLGYEAALRSARGPLLYALFFVAVIEMDSAKRLRELRMVVIISSISLGVVGIAGSLGYLTPYFPNLPVGIISNVYTRPNFFAEPALTIPCIIFLVLLLKFSPPRTATGKALIIVGIILDIALLMLSATRGFWLGIVAAFLLMLAVLFRKKSFGIKNIATVTAGAVAMTLVIDMLSMRLRGVSLLGGLRERLQTGLIGDPNVDYRTDEIKAYYDSFLKSPLIGHGYGSPVYFSLDNTLGFAHNQYIWILETTGIVGFAFFLGFFSLSALVAIRGFVRSTNSDLRQVVYLTTFAMICGYAVTSMSSPEFTNPTTAPLIATLMGTCYALSVREDSWNGEKA